MENESWGGGTGVLGGGFEGEKKERKFGRDKEVAMDKRTVND